MRIFAAVPDTPTVQAEEVNPSDAPREDEATVNLLHAKITTNASADDRGPHNVFHADVVQLVRRLVNGQLGLVLSVG